MVDNTSTGKDMPKNHVGDIKKHNYTFWYILAGIALIAIVAIALILNNNYGSGDASSDQISSSLEIDNGDAKIDWSKYGSYNISLTESYTITAPGTYYLTGEIPDGLIVVNSANSKVRLILDNVTIKNSSGPAIVCYAADDLVIELVGDNYLEDSATYASSYDEDVAGAIYSKSDLTFQGDGALTLVANHEDAIVSKDDLKFNSGTYNITSADDGIRGKDSVYIVNGNFTITAKGDGIKSTNETDASKGFVLIEDGIFDITASAKGIKAINSIMTYGGTYNINSRDDAVHTNSYIGIVDGEFTLASGDDGIHADKTLIIDGGTINIAKSYEGLEAQAVTINDGKISIFASDDGINAGGGADASATNRPGAGAFDSNINCILTINGGDIYVNASGDGVDSNGYIYINSGIVIIDGPTTNGNGALDSGISITQSGGTVIAIGSSGMAETLGKDSTINNVSIYLSTTQAAGTKIEIKNSAGETVLSHTSAKTFSNITAGTSDFKSGETYTLYLNNAEYTTFTISGTITSIGNSSQNFNQMNRRR